MEKRVNVFVTACVEGKVVEEAVEDGDCTAALGLYTAADAVLEGESGAGAGAQEAVNKFTAVHLFETENGEISRTEICLNLAFVAPRQ